MELLLLVALIGGQRRASDLIASVVAVGDSVAFVRLVDALLAAGAFQLLCGAGDGRTALLVFVVEAVVVAVADPRLRNAVAGSRTGELEVGAGAFGAKVSFIASVAAVVLRVALPGGRNAAAVLAGELRCVARGVDAVHLVGRVSAVVIRVAFERFRNTAAGIALELVGLARGFRAVLLLVGIVQTVVISVADPRLGDAALVVARKVPRIGTGLRTTEKRKCRRKRPSNWSKRLT